MTQNARFQRGVQSGLYHIVKSYEERASAGDITKRKLFVQMLDELADNGAQCIVVDSPDRFARNLEDAFAVIKRLRERGINIWPLEWDRESPPDILTYDSNDYIKFHNEIWEAQAYRRRISVNVGKSYAERRQLGAHTGNKLPFGVRRLGDTAYDAVGPDPDTAWIIGEIDKRFLSGELPSTVFRWAQAVGAPWATFTALFFALERPLYVTAGLRSQEDQDRILALLRDRSQRYGRRQIKHEPLEFTGVFLCGVCGGILSGRHSRQREPYGIREYVECARHRPQFACWVERFRDQWMALVRAIDLASWVEIETAVSPELARERRGLERQLGKLDQDEATLSARLNAALVLYGSSEPALKNEAEIALRALNADRAALAAQRSILQGEIQRTEPPPHASLEDIVTMLRSFSASYESFENAERNQINRALVKALGRRPTLYRETRMGEPVLAWEHLDSTCRINNSVL